MSGKSCLITGATSGIGRATAVELGRLGWDLWLVGRDERRGDAVVREIARLGKGGGARFIKADVSSLQQVRELADAVRNDTPHLDVLVNNAGARLMSFGSSADGVELTFATNYLGHFLLTLLLFGLLEKGEPGRIINVASGTHRAGKGEFERVLRGEPYDGRKAYAEAKLAMVLFTCELARQLQETTVAVFAVDPGGVATRFGRNNGLVPWLRHCLYYLKQGSLLTPRQGCRTVVHLATAEGMALHSGGYYFEGREVKPSPLAEDPELGRKLWSLSVALAGLTRAEVSQPWLQAV